MSDKPAASSGGIRREVLETILLLGIFGAAIGQVATGRESVQEIRVLRTDINAMMVRINDIDSLTKLMSIMQRQQDSQLGDIEKRLQDIERQKKR